MKTLQEIKDEVAVNNGYADWAQIDMTDNSECECNAIKVTMIDEVAKRYAEEVLREAAEKATLTIERKDKVVATKQLFWISDDGDHLKINKDSILNLINELK